ncbi:MAG: hypothetical protein CMK59_02995 [Proteobacteria bacterium]|nr:hypothetical protein [Pseudomonadota bacterium]
MLYVFIFWACSGAKTDTGTEIDTGTSGEALEEESDGAMISDVSVRLNELLAKSSTTSDWLELHNTGTETVDLSGWGLIDDIDEDEEWVFPASSSIEAGGFVMVWADDGEEGDGLHATFKLSKEGEAVYLLDPSGVVVEEVVYPELEEDQSYALQVDGSWLVTDQITPGASN